MTQRITFHFLTIYLFLANIVDALMTYDSVSSGEAKELNPLMRYLLETNAIYFFAAKTALVLLGLILLIKSKNRKVAT